LVPLALRYTEASRPEQPSPIAAYAGDTTLGQSLWGIAGCNALVANLSVLSPLEGNDRKVLAVEARAAIADHLGLTLDVSVAQQAGENPKTLLTVLVF
jgi:1-acyl-sn-glycerol-3-phosphate acyltransferase